VGVAIAVGGAFFFTSSSIRNAYAQTRIIEGFVSHGALQWPYIRPFAFLRPKARTQVGLDGLAAKQAGFSIVANEGYSACPGGR
jgi:hypothetical protein